MKNLIYILLVLLIVSCKSKTPAPKTAEELAKIEAKRFSPVAISEVNSVKKNRAYDLGKRLMETCNTSKFKSFNSSEATESVIKNATIEKVSKTCQKINMRNGRFIDLDLIEVIQDNETEDLVFKYAIKYQKKFYQRELKIVVNSENKVSSISTKEIAKKPM